MGKRTKKLKASSDDGTRRIGDIFLARPKTKMAAASDSPGLSSDEDPLDSPEAIPEVDDPFSAVQLGDLGAPATKGDILGLLKHLRTWFRTDIALLREEVTAVTDRVKATEEDITSMAQCQTDATERLQQLQGSHQALQVTKTLREAGVRYRWGPSHTLVATQGETTRRLTSAADSDPFLHSLGLNRHKPDTAKPEHSWDISNIVPFVPRNEAAQDEKPQLDPGSTYPSSRGKCRRTGRRS
ncbi:Hypothetical predicted protein [Pelobates cultripes]|uniref:Uncharacterized protein n=1 Tax=Pelobates cultripes TaxID=61616 RepID=A0AAD1RCT6_PELCU|nr:Hypothetical predicted protein [Pelobates cultripes]